MVKVSVIIPVYNTEEHLRECLDSVICQTLKDIEIICVNDGSTDNSLQILKEYAAQDNRVKIVNQQNSGAGAARNNGMKAAVGKYFSFIDADDFVRSDMYEKLYNKAEEQQCDITLCNFEYVDNNKNIVTNRDARLEYKIFEKHGVFNSKEYPFEVLNRFQHAPWNKLFKASFIKENNIKFHELKRANDLFFVRCAMILADKICCLDEKLLFYRLSDTSLQGTNYKNPYDVLKTLCALKKFLVEKELYQKLSDKFKYLAIGDINYTLRSVKGHFFVYVKFLNYVRVNVLKELDLKEDEIKIYSPVKLAMSRIFNIKNSRSASNKVITVFGFDFKIKKKKAKIASGIKVPYVSVIVSNYNNEEYLDRCLRSLTGQSLQNIEIICVDDGSDDNSLQILEKYAKVDDRIKIISQENQGQGAARNNALDVAKGDFVSFVDSDDWLRFDALTKLYHGARENKLDMLSFGGINVQKETMKEEYNPYYSFEYLPKNFRANCFNYKKARKFLVKMAVSACLTMYKRSFLEKNDIRFPEGIFFEDNIFFTKAIFLAKRCGILRETLYYRLIHQNQVTANKTKHFGDHILMTKKMKELMDELDIPGKIKAKYIKKYVNSTYKYYQNMNEEEKAKFKDGIDDILKFI